MLLEVDALLLPGSVSSTGIAPRLRGALSADSVDGLDVQLSRWQSANRVSLDACDAPHAGLLLPRQWLLSGETATLVTRLSIASSLLRERFTAELLRQFHFDVRLFPSAEHDILSRGRSLPSAAAVQAILPIHDVESVILDWNSTAAIVALSFRLGGRSPGGLVAGGAVYAHMSVFASGVSQLPPSGEIPFDSPKFRTQSPDGFFSMYVDDAVLASTAKSAVAYSVETPLGSTASSSSLYGPFLPPDPSSAPRLGFAFVGPVTVLAPFTIQPTIHRLRGNVFHLVRYEIRSNGLENPLADFGPVLISSLAAVEAPAATASSGSVSAPAAGPDWLASKVLVPANDCFSETVGSGGSFVAVFRWFPDAMVSVSPGGPRVADIVISIKWRLASAAAETVHVHEFRHRLVHDEVEPELKLRLTVPPNIRLRSSEEAINIRASILNLSATRRGPFALSAAHKDASEQQQQQQHIPTAIPELSQVCVGDLGLHESREIVLRLRVRGPGLHRIPSFCLVDTTDNTSFGGSDQDMYLLATIEPTASSG